MTPPSTEITRRLQELEAAKKIFTTPQKRLQWYIDFADIQDLQALSPTQRELKGYELRALMRVDNDVWKQKKLAPMNLKKLTEIQKQIRHAFDSLYKKNVWEFAGPKSVVIFRHSNLDAKELDLDVSTYTQEEALVVVHSLAWALVEAKQHLRWCKRCSKPFVATKRQEYCGTNCSQTIRNEKKKKLRQAIQVKT